MALPESLIILRLRGSTLRCPQTSCCCPASTPRVKQNRRKHDLFVFASSMFPRLKSGLIGGPFINLTSTEGKEKSKHFISSQPPCSHLCRSFCFFSLLLLLYERPPGVREWIKHQWAGRKGRTECRALFEQRAAVEVTVKALLSTRTWNHQGNMVTSNIWPPSWIVIFSQVSTSNWGFSKPCWSFVCLVRLLDLSFKEMLLTKKCRFKRI